jgi:hypothetical protein
MKSGKMVQFGSFGHFFESTLQVDPPGARDLCRQVLSAQ